ncbi:type VII secretion protein EssA [Metabacillus schmidteae]|uniref:type VII secretion protein EssA n=1 Tax=Metabacillus schmidteae TaxID=2730405 RepID=UPI00158D95F4|nr:type VII secretion protein EssA [Metabacillus schmidteae]
MMLKSNKKFIWFLFFVISYLLLQHQVAVAETNIDELVPNDYQKENVKINRDLLLDKQQNQQRTNIPEEQKGLTFEGEKTSNDTEVVSSLFKENSKNLNTIKTKAENLHLFSSTDKVSQGQTVEEEPTSSTSPLSLLIWVLVVICIISLITVILFWNKSTKQKMTTNN